jgi:hypothetical protein
MTIEQAVRRMAGVFVLAGMGLGFWVHPGFYALVVFVGVNLIQSSFTGFCPAEAMFRRLGVGKEGSLKGAAGAR